MSNFDVCEFLFDMTVAGFKHQVHFQRTFKEQFDYIKNNLDFIRLEKEDNNNYDPNAIKISAYLKNGAVEKLGYVPKEHARTIRNLLKLSQSTWAFLVVIPPSSFRFKTFTDAQGKLVEYVTIDIAVWHDDYLSKVKNDPSHYPGWFKQLRDSPYWTNTFSDSIQDFSYYILHCFRHILGPKPKIKQKSTLDKTIELLEETEM